MKTFAIICSWTGLGLLAITRAEPPVASDATRLISVGSAVTETVYALHGEKNLVGVDTSSLYPADATKLPQVGYERALAAEGVLSLHPTLIIASSESGPPNVLEQIKSAGTPLLIVPAEHSVAGAKKKIELIAAALHKEEAGRQLITKIDGDLQPVSAILAASAEKPRVLFIYARGAGTLNVAGQETAADGMIQLAGGVNAVDGYKGYRPLTPEAAVTARPDVILLTTRGLESAGGKEGLLNSPGLALTPAGKSGQIVVIDDVLLLSFGPRTGQAVAELAKALHAGKEIGVAAGKDH
jgi:iron complex transport system substrate-binding protein